MRRSVLVVGAGIGGITAATHLARAGFDVTVVERNGQTGGRCGRLVRDGHRFDMGPTLFVMPLLYEAEFRALGVELQERLDLQRVDPTYLLLFDDGTRLALTSDMAMMEDQLESIEAGSFGAFRRYLTEGNLHYQLVVDHLVNREYRHPTDLLTLVPASLRVGIRPLLNHFRNVRGYFAAPRLRSAFTFQDLYVGLSPFRAPAALSFLPYTELAHGVWYPSGGMYSVIETLTSLAREAGVTLRLGSEVTRIETIGDRAVGVSLADGSMLAADVVVANADLPYVYGHLLPRDRTADVLLRKEFSCSAIAFLWGVDTIYEQLPPHLLFIADQYADNFDAITRRLTLPANPTFYVHAPTRVDPSMAPAGHDTLNVIVPVGHLRDDAGTGWDQLRDIARDHVLRRLEAFGVRDIAAHIEFEESYTPVTWSQRLNLAKGSTHGLSHTLTQMAWFRPSNRHRRYRNLFFVGASTHPGTGMPTSMVSGRYAAERISAEYS